MVVKLTIAGTTLGSRSQCGRTARLCRLSRTMFLVCHLILPQNRHVNPTQSRDTVPRQRTTSDCGLARQPAENSTFRSSTPASTKPLFMINREPRPSLQYYTQMTSRSSRKTCRKVHADHRLASNEERSFVLSSNTFGAPLHCLILSDDSKSQRRRGKSFQTRWLSSLMTLTRHLLFRNCSVYS